MDVLFRPSRASRLNCFLLPFVLVADCVCAALRLLFKFTFSSEIMFQLNQLCALGFIILIRLFFNHHGFVVGTNCNARYTKKENWYRPGASAFDGFTELHAELAEYFAEVSGVLLIGDLNIHRKRWLRFSNDNTHIGSEMKALCDFPGLSQIVCEPTREQYLLDLAICDLVGATATVLPKIADHEGVRVDVPIPVINEV